MNINIKRLIKNTKWNAAEVRRRGQSIAIAETLEEIAEALEQQQKLLREYVEATVALHVTHSSTVHEDVLARHELATAAVREALS